MFLQVLCVVGLWVLDPISVTSATGDPLPVVGGTDAETCEFPSAVSIRKFGNTYCSGSLIHPQVVITAAHCLHPDNNWGTPTDVGFGEEGWEPAFSMEVERCELHPEYDHSAEAKTPENAHDLAFCVLSDPLLNVAPTPVLMGCEVEQLAPGVEVQVVGFGASVADIDEEGHIVTKGGGTKRHVTQSVEKVDALDQVYLLGMGGSSCYGDSGGPAYLQLDDGSWRVFAAVARGHRNTPEDQPLCTYGGVHTGVWNEVGWLEGESGFDVTPCHDADGTWNPGPDCGGFPLDPQGAADWSDGCGAQALSGPSITCAPDDPEGTGDTGDDPGDPGRTTTGGGFGTGEGRPARQIRPRRAHRGTQGCPRAPTAPRPVRRWAQGCPTAPSAIPGPKTMVRMGAVAAAAALRRRPWSSAWRSCWAGDVGISASSPAASRRAWFRSIPEMRGRTMLGRRSPGGRRSGSRSGRSGRGSSARGSLGCVGRLP